MQTKIKNMVKAIQWDYLKDIRFLALLAFAGLMLLTAWSAVRILETNYKLQQDIARIDQQNQVAELENQNLKLTNAYYETDTYLELAARRHFNKGLPGEKLIIVPEEVALQKAGELPAIHEDVQEEAADPTGYQKNLSDWMKFLFHAS